MSHSKERNEKICLNCGADLNGRYCHKCGQENIEPKENFWHLVNHFVEDLTHFDGKFFITLKDLLFKPGFLSKEYLKGRRASYLHPIRMYVFTSAVFFLIFFSFVHLEDNGVVKVSKGKKSNVIHIGIDGAESVETKKANDSLVKVLDSIKSTKNNDKLSILGDANYAKNVNEYDSIQSSLPANKRDGFFRKFYNRRRALISQNMLSGDENVYRKLVNELIHSIPKMMFILLPLIALLLKLLYVRKKQFLYIDHAIFIIHLFVAIYMFWLFAYGFDYLGNITGLKFFKWLEGSMLFVILFYQYKALRNFYMQRRFKTIIKFCIFNFITFLIFLFIGVIFFINTASSAPIN